jgi:hypothetical protein
MSPPFRGVLCNATTDINIAAGATAYTSKTTGITFIFVINEGLWFGSRMENSLINPNQLHMFGIDLCDDPFDQHRALRFIDPNTGIVVPFEIQGTIIFFETRCLTHEELDTCQHIILSSDAPWNPSTLELSLNSCWIKEEERSCIVSQFHALNMILTSLQHLLF